jgi:uncharacterized protein YrrD
MIRATELGGRAVVDMDTAEKLGTIDKIVLDPEARRVAGYVIVSRGGSLLGNPRHKTALPASSVHAIGPDAVTVRHLDSDGTDGASLDHLPRASDVIGRKVLSQEGRLLGIVDDVLISGADGRIVGYQLAGPTAMSRFEGLFGDRKPPHAPYLRADADLRTGRDLIVAPEDAVGDWSTDETADQATVTAAAIPPNDTPRAGSRFDHPSTWFRRDAAKPSEERDHPLR